MLICSNLIGTIYDYFDKFLSIDQNLYNDGLKNKVIRYNSPEITDNKINLWIVDDELIIKIYWIWIGQWFYYLWIKSFSEILVSKL